MFFAFLIQPDLEEMDDLSEMRNELMDRVNTIMTKATDYRNSFDIYSYLWVDDRNEFMRQFLIYNHVLTADEIEAHSEEGVPENPPTLRQFREQVYNFCFTSAFSILRWLCKFLFLIRGCNYLY